MMNAVVEKQLLRILFPSTLSHGEFRSSREVTGHCPPAAFPLLGYPAPHDKNLFYRRTGTPALSGDGRIDLPSPPFMVGEQNSDFWNSNYKVSI